MKGIQVWCQSSAEKKHDFAIIAPRYSYIVTILVHATECYCPHHSCAVVAHSASLAEPELTKARSETGLSFSI